MEYERDEGKATANLSKHGVTFEEAKTVFNDPLSTILIIPMASTVTLSSANLNKGACYWYHTLNGATLFG